MTHQGFLKLRDKYFEWQENTHNEVEGIGGKQENNENGDNDENGRREDVVGSNELIR